MTLASINNILNSHIFCVYQTNKSKTTKYEIWEVLSMITITFLKFSINITL